ncbi:MAG: zinc ABC transporter substrate-binding protein [Bacteroidetes bacterium]|nr:zinc ABC transporter substrate-binding protein [Bacteroidota bacterium]
MITVLKTTVPKTTVLKTESDRYSAVNIIRWLSPFLLALVILLGGCAPRSSDRVNPVSPEHPIRVVATTSVIADLVRQIGGDLVVVEGLMGPGVDPHLYQASEGDVSAITEAELVFYNGLHLEGKMVEIFEQMEGRGMPVHAVTDGLSDEDLLSSAQFTGNHDPHVWFDPGLWKKAAQAVGTVLSAHAPEQAERFAAATAAYEADLDMLTAWARTSLDAIPEDYRVLVTSHDAFGYFGRAFGLDVHGLQGISTVLEAGTADVRDLAAFVAERRIPSLFLESSISPRGMEAVRAAVRDRGFEVRIGGTLYGDALGGPGTGADTYVGMLRSNVETIVAGLTPAS